MQSMLHDELTTPRVARGADCSDSVVRKYADLGLIPCRRSSDGRRFYPPEAVEAVVELLAKRKRG